ncbi:MAG: YfhO family protein, partial [Flavobacteriales bacterium]|nr:YfhO family protein [Flavobacteriales bacterium]
FVADSVGHRIFPLWDPYQHGGYPIHGDMRSSFAPEPWIIGLLGGYNVYTLHVLFTLYIGLGGTGVALLAGHFTPVHRARLVAGMAYVFCGFFVGHGQEMFGIVAAAWIPWVLHFFLRLQRTASWADVWAVALFLVLCLLGGYQALSIILAFLLALLFIVEAAHDARRGDFAFIRRKLLLHAVLGVAVVAAMAVLVVTYVQVGTAISRFGGMTLEQASVNPLTPAALISFVLPFTVVVEPEYFRTDVSMSNAYVGLLTLIAALLALRRRWSAVERTFIAFGACCLLISFGAHAPFHGFVFRYVPLMDLFRMPSFFSYFTQLALLLMAAGTIGRAMQEDGWERRRLPLVAALLAACILGVALWIAGPSRMPLGGMVRSLVEMRSASEGFSWRDHLGAQAMLQALLLLGFAAACWLLRGRGRAMRWVLPAFVVLEMGIAAQLNFPVTVGGPPEPARLQRILDATPQGFTIPDLHTPVGAHTDGPAWMTPLWRNTHNYTKTVSLDGFNSFQLDMTTRFESDMPVVRDAVRSRPVLYFGAGCRPLHHFSEADAQAGMVAVADGSEADCPSTGTAPGDTLIVERFDPGDVLVRTKRAQPGVLVLVQTDHPGWRASVDGKAIDHFTAMGAFIGCVVPGGDHEVRFQYRNPAVVRAAGFSALAILLIAALALYHALRGGAHSPARARNITFLAAGLAVGTALLAWRSGESGDEERTHAYQRLADHTRTTLREGDHALFALDRPGLMDSLLQGSDAAQRSTYIRDAGGVGSPATRLLLDSLRASGVERIIIAGHGAPLDPEVEELVLLTYPQAVRSGDRFTFFNVYAREGEREPLFDAWCDMDRMDAHWPFDPAWADTSISHQGAASWRIDEHQRGSPELRIPVEGPLVDGGRLVIEAWARMEHERPGDALYVEVYRDDARIWSAGKLIREQATGTGHWFPMLTAVEPPFDLRTGDFIKVFAWGGDHGPIHLDDMRVRLFGRDALQIDRSRIR